MAKIAFPRTMRNIDPGKLSSALAENMRYLENVLNRTFNFNHSILANIGVNDHHAKYTDGEVDTIVATHAAVVAAHHAKYTDAEADARIAAAGVWSDWTPTYTNLTLGNGTVIARSVQNVDLVTARFKLTFGSTTTVDGSGVTVSLPVNGSTVGADTNGPSLGMVVMRESGGFAYSGFATLATTSTVFIGPIFDNGSFERLANLSATSPFTWGTGDEASFLISYEAA